MAFGRDGSELEISILSIQKRNLEEAMKEIVRTSTDENTVKIAKKALRDMRTTEKNLSDSSFDDIFPLNQENLITEG